MNFKQFKELILILGILVLIGGIFYSFVEGWRFLDALYFSIVTITTLGYGDFVPLTDIGKVFTIIYSLSGIAIAFYFLAIIGKYIAMELEKKEHKHIKIRKNKGFDISKLRINEDVDWIPEKGVIFEGKIKEIGPEHIKVALERRNKEVLSRSEKKSIIVKTNGKVKRV